MAKVPLIIVSLRYVFPFNFVAWKIKKSYIKIKLSRAQRQSRYTKSNKVITMLSYFNDISLVLINCFHTNHLCC